MRRIVAALTVAGLCGGAAVAYALYERPEGSVATPAAQDRDPSTTSKPGRETPAGPHLRFLAVAGGSVPELNQVSIEQDLGLAARILRGPGRVLFAAGPRAPVVQVLDDDLDPDPTLLALADLFNPRGGRDATYRAPEIHVDAPATAARFVADLRASTRGGAAPLLVLLAGHGLPGETPAANTVELWGQSSISVADLSQILADAERPVQLVATTCFSGGFADIVFERADPTAGGAPQVHCGLFATTWDLEAAGCDPDPRRAKQQGYALHMFHALARQDRDGAPLPAEDIDFDGDGEISLLEAHSRVRIASGAADVPTTTSERWLRVAAEGLDPAAAAVAAPVALAEEQAVIKALGRQLGLSADPGLAAQRLATLEAEIRALEQQLHSAQALEDESYRAAAAELLARWPLLDDPWHPRFGHDYALHRDAITKWLRESPTWAAYVQARDDVRDMSDAIADKRARAAPFERLARAVETTRLAASLANGGGDGWTRYEALLACERRTPARVKSP